MKVFRILIIVPVLATLTGCLSEDYTGCFPRENVTLLFSLPDRDGNETFIHHISTVDVIVYNSNREHLLTRHVNQEELATFQGVHLLLNPGVYHLICWGNAHDNTKYNGIGSVPDPTVTYAVINADNSVGNSDPVYSTGVIATIPEREAWQGTAVFGAAHRQVEIYIKGYYEGGHTLPHVELTNLPAGLCLFDMAQLPDRNTVAGSRDATRSIMVQGQHYATAYFRTFLFETNNSITINIISPVTNQSVFDISLREAMALGAHSDPITIRIVIEFKSTGVTVTIPDWSSEDVGFGFGHGY
jgi:hypothetical protein